MILYGCDSIQGKSHKINNTVCQDACAQACIMGNWIVSATADGVGSCRLSDIGSRIAVDTVVKVCTSYFPIDGDDEAIIALIRTSFNAALIRIYEKSVEDDEDFDLYNTTLDVVIFNGSGKVYYGHCGDGGIYTLSSDGSYKEITTVQEGEEANSVKPLRCGNKVWEFGIEEGDIAAVASFTDGIRDKLSPPILSNYTNKIKVPLADFFMRLDVCGLSEAEAVDIIKDRFDMYDKYFASEECNIDDDATIALIINTNIPIAESQYEKPDKIEMIYSSVMNNYGHLSNDKKRKVMKIYLDSMDAEDEKNKLSDDSKTKILDTYFLDATDYANENDNKTVVDKEELQEALNLIKNLPDKSGSGNQKQDESGKRNIITRQIKKKWKRKKNKKNKSRKKKR